MHSECINVMTNSTWSSFSSKTVHLNGIHSNIPFCSIFSQCIIFFYTYVYNVVNLKPRPAYFILHILKQYSICSYSAQLSNCNLVAWRYFIRTMLYMPPFMWQSNLTDLHTKHVESSKLVRLVCAIITNRNRSGNILGEHKLNHVTCSKDD